MTPLRCVSIALLIGLFVAVAIAQNPAPAALPLGSASIAEIKGDVQIANPQGGAISAQRGTVLAAESKITTAKGSVLLDLPDGSQVLVKPNSNVVLKAPDQGKGYWFELLLGRINAKVQKRLGNAPSFRMGTPTAVITVRGTRFSVDVDKKEHTYVEVYEGVVEVAGFFHGAPVMVRPGYSTDVNPNHDPEPPRGRENREMDNRWNPGGAPGGHGEDEHDTRPGTRQPSNPPNTGEHDPHDD
ncbi:MAG TPA: FecR family protein [Terriglobales bacterium]|nr:FecR family protein [Terriglobales bacterium]